MLVVPLFEIKLSKKPIAIIKTGDRNISFVKVNKYNSKYFTTKEGQTYELDDEYEYRYKKTGIYFYNFSNSKPISLSALNEIDAVMKETGESELFNKDRFMQSVGNDPSIDVNSLNIPKDIAGVMTPDTKRFLQDHATDDETSKTDMMINVHTQKRPIPKYSSELLGMGMNRTGYAFVQVGYQRLDIVPMYTNNNRAYTQYGVFEIDKDNVYFIKKQMICFFIVNNEKEQLTPPMKKPAYKSMKNMIRKKRWDNLESFIKPIPKGNSSTIEGVKKKAIPKSVSISSEKKLVQFQADSPSVCYTTMKELHLTKEAVATKLSDPFKKAIPIMLVFGAVMGIAVVMSNAPPVIDTVADRVVGKPDVYVMTPEEYEEWQVANGLLSEDERRFVTDQPPESMTVQDEEIAEALTPPPPVDDVAPQLLEPIIKTFEADNTNGMKVKFQVMVLDNVDEGLIPDCDPNPGEILGIGEHDVYCTAEDSSGNVGDVNFTIRVTVRDGVEPTGIIPRIQPMPGDIIP